MWRDTMNAMTSVKQQAAKGMPLRVPQQPACSALPLLRNIFIVGDGTLSIHTSISGVTEAFMTVSSIELGCGNGSKFTRIKDALQRQDLGVVRVILLVSAAPDALEIAQALQTEFSDKRILVVKPWASQLEKDGAIKVFDRLLQESDVREIAQISG